MPRLTPGNRLYFYQLFSTRLGVGVQTPLPKVEELLDEEDVDPADVGCDDVQQLLSQMPEFIKLTVFKKGRAYVTVQRREDWNQVLARAGEERQKKAPATGAKAWKHKKSSKDPKPAKPRHRRERHGGSGTEKAAMQPDGGDERAAESVASATEPVETVVRDETKAVQASESGNRATEAVQASPQPKPNVAATQLEDAGQQEGPSQQPRLTRQGSRRSPRGMSRARRPRQASFGPRRTPPPSQTARTRARMPTPPRQSMHPHRHRSPPPATRRPPRRTASPQSN